MLAVMGDSCGSSSERTIQPLGGDSSRNPLAAGSASFLSSACLVGLAGGAANLFALSQCFPGSYSCGVGEIPTLLRGHSGDSFASPSPPCEKPRLSGSKLWGNFYCLGQFIWDEEGGRRSLYFWINETDDQLEPC